MNIFSLLRCGIGCAVGLGLLCAAPAINAQVFWPYGQTDRDEDGIDDNLEAQLIDRFRPQYYYSTGELYWPTSATWFAQRSEIRGFNMETLISRSEVAANPYWALRLHEWLAANDPNALDILRAWNQTHTSPKRYPLTSMEFYPVFQWDLKFNINNDFWRGETVGQSESVKARTGIYAQVQKITHPLSYEGRQDRYLGEAFKITYYQFFAFNGNPVPIGRHEGDWLYLDVYCGAQAPYPLLAIVYHHHGDHESDLIDDRVDILMGNDLPQDDKPVCYLEFLGHEWYPRPGIRLSNPYDGLGVAYRVTNVINLGQQGAEMLRPNGSAFDPADTPAIQLERRLALFFNGRWGHDIPDPGDQTSPEGPPLKRNNGYLDDRDSLDLERPYHVAYVDRNYQIPELPMDFIAPSGYGNRYFPFRDLNNALTQGGIYGVRDWGVVRVKPGEYTVPTNSGNLRRITQPMRLEANGSGTVRIQAAP